MIDYISLSIVIFIAICALLWMREHRDKQQQSGAINADGVMIAGEPLKKGVVICLSNWQLYEMTDDEIIPLGVCMGEIETDTLI